MGIFSALLATIAADKELKVDDADDDDGATPAGAPFLVWLLAKCDVGVTNPLQGSASPNRKRRHIDSFLFNIV